MSDYDKQLGEVIIYQTEDGLSKIEVSLNNETVWLSIDQMADLFKRDKSTISRHINNVFKEGELRREATVANFATVQLEGDRTVKRNIEYYNLDVIISVGYRVKSIRGTQFRIWANSVLKEYIIKGFAMDDDRLKGNGGGNYWKELLDRIRDIRSSEKVLYRQVLDLYATSVDYNPKSEESMTNSTPHICRHTYCTNMARSGMNPKTPQYLMGHSDISITMNTYTHLGLDDARDEMIRMEELEQARKAVNGDKVVPISQMAFRAV